MTRKTAQERTGRTVREVYGLRGQGETATAASAAVKPVGGRTIGGTREENQQTGPKLNSLIPFGIQDREMPGTSLEAADLLAIMAKRYIGSGFLARPVSARIGTETYNRILITRRSKPVLDVLLTTSDELVANGWDCFDASLATVHLTIGETPAAWEDVLHDIRNGKQVGQCSKPGYVPIEDLAPVNEAEAEEWAGRISNATKRLLGDEYAASLKTYPMDGSPDGSATVDMIMFTCNGKPIKGIEAVRDPREATGTSYAIIGRNEAHDENGTTTIREIVEALPARAKEQEETEALAAEIDF